jgi:hypothetical protein
MKNIVFLSLTLCISSTAWGQEDAPFECDNNFGTCGTPEMSGGGGGGGGSVLIAFTDLGDTYQHADDFDDDGIEDPQDNCLRVRNIDQLDQDGDGVGDACDNCFNQENANQFDKDGDLLGDLCDADLDGDEIENDLDICPNIPNPAIMINDKLQQPDLDGDGIGDACDDDLDGDGIPSINDPCPLQKDINMVDESNLQVCFPDLDQDQIFDVGAEADNCVGVYNPDQLDQDGDGIGDLCDLDDDDDSILDLMDNCPLIPNLDQIDEDRDFRGNACDDRFCYVALGYVDQCLDPEAALFAFSPNIQVDTGNTVDLRLFINRRNQDFEYSWKVVSAPSGATQAIEYSKGNVDTSEVFNYRYAANQEAVFTPTVEGEYVLEVTVRSLSADPITNEVDVVASFQSKIVAVGAFDQGCQESKSALPSLLLSLLALGLVVRRRLMMV